MEEAIIDTKGLTSLNPTKFIGFSNTTYKALGVKIIPCLCGRFFEEKYSNYGDQLAWLKSSGKVKLIPLDKTNIFLANCYNIKKTASRYNQFLIIIAIISALFLSNRNENINILGIILIFFFTSLFIISLVHVIYLKNKLNRISNSFGVVRLNNDARTALTKSKVKIFIQRAFLSYIIDLLEDLFSIEPFSLNIDHKNEYIASYIFSRVIDSYKDKIVIKST